MQPRRNTIGTRLREARRAEVPRATQQGISARVEILGIPISDNILGKMENGECPATDIQLLALALALQVHPMWLIGFLEDSRPSPQRKAELERILVTVK